MTRPPFDTGHLTGPESDCSRAVVIPRPGLPGALISRRPELADVGIGSHLIAHITEGVAA